MPPGAPRPPGAPPPPGAPVMSNKKPPMKPGVPMKQLHWGKIPDAKIKGTIWEKDVKDEKVKLDEKKLEELFCARKAAAPGGGGGGGADGKPEKKKDEIVTLVDPKTTNNTAIAISRFKKSPEQITSAMRAGDVDAFTQDQLAALLSILPSAEDVELVQGFDGPAASLGKAEQFFLAVAAVPRYQIRTKCMLVRATYPEKFGDLQERIGGVARCAKQVQKSRALKAVLETALALGNYLNGTSNKGSAWGFKLESLGKLGGTKTGDNSSTLLHYMARHLEKDDVAARLTSEMADLEGAARTVWKDETSDLSALKASLKQVETQVKLDKIEAFTKSMGAFAQGSATQMEELVAQQAEADETCKELKKLFGEDEKKTEPEDIFSTLHNFVLTFQKAHKYNKDLVEKKERDARMAAAKAAGKAAARGAAQRKNLVDNVEDGTAGRAARQRRQTHGSAGTASVSGAPAI